ncbi:MAG: putative glycoside hydrolase [Patescibacteria group bacterium]
MYDRGFDEIQFDYVRYPSDGDMKKIAYEYVANDTVVAETVTASSSTSTPKLSASKIAEQGRRRTMKSFFSYMRGELVDMPLSADVFGMVLTNTDDLTIGQQLDDISPYVDYVSGMIYPSHFNKVWNGINNTHTHPYETVHDSSQMGLKRMTTLFGTTTAAAKSRPWLQDFSIYGVVYNAPEVKAQIKALDDLGIHSFLLWNASNNYTPHVLDKPAQQAN